MLVRVCVVFFFFFVGVVVVLLVSCSCSFKQVRLLCGVIDLRVCVWGGVYGLCVLGLFVFVGLFAAVLLCVCGCGLGVLITSVFFLLFVLRVVRACVCLLFLSVLFVVCLFVIKSASCFMFVCSWVCTCLCVFCWGRRLVYLFCVSDCV